MGDPSEVDDNETISSSSLRFRTGSSARGSMVGVVMPRGGGDGRTVSSRKTKKLRVSLQDVSSNCEVETRRKAGPASAKRK